MYIALSDKLLNEFFKFRRGMDFDKESIQYLFKYLQPFSITREQLENLNLDVAIQQKIISGGDIISPSTATTQADLINDTLYKIMLTDDNSTYPYVNILGDEVDVNYTSTYNGGHPTGQNRDKAKEHIKNLIENAKYINVVDAYLYENWDENFQLLKEILPNSQSIILYCKFERYLTLRDKSKFSKLKKEKPKIKNFTEKDKLMSQIDIRNIHDRYIITDTVKIILSGGINYLVDTSKDFTYIIKEK